MNLAVAIEGVLGRSPTAMQSLSGGCVGELYLVRLAGDERVVAKVDDASTGRLDVEGRMLRYLREHSELPVPAVLHAEPALLLMQWMPGNTGCSRLAEPKAAALLSELHGVRAERHGFECDTLIGGLLQPNPWCDSWLQFFAEHRLLDRGRRVRDLGRLDDRRLRQLERLAGRLGDWLDEPDAPRLLHGDVWSGNVLSRGNEITAFLDPAIYYGHPEVELAFITLFSTFGERFFAAYRQSRPLDEDFFEVRRHLYNLYPLLVHSELFGGGYVDDVKSVLDRFA